ncbi:MAG: Crp/Fnr family transcriptional regulator [Prevotellaceae bacterium]|nr:Crp/Fnr family transcriptional regulator [Prevotellaceae bacterium]
MEQSPIYDQLLQLPLFQGHSRSDLTDILSKIKVDFRSFHEGQVIAQQDDPCRHIVFLIEGSVQLTRTSLHKDIIFAEHFHSPAVFGTDTAFGLRQNFSHTITAQDNVRTLVLSKQNLADHMFNHEVFRYNMLNLLSTRIQRSNSLLWTDNEGDTLQRFAVLLKRNFIYHGGQKQITGGMVALARMLGEPRLRISQMLNALEQKGLVTLARKRIIIPHLEAILQQS